MLRQIPVHDDSLRQLEAKIVAEFGERPAELFIRQQFGHTTAQKGITKDLVRVMMAYASKFPEAILQIMQTVGGYIVKLWCHCKKETSCSEICPTDKDRPMVILTVGDPGMGDRLDPHAREMEYRRHPRTLPKPE